MPFATGLDHPRFTILESLFIRSKESQNLLQSMQSAEEMEDIDDLGVSAYDRKSPRKASNRTKSSIPLEPIREKALLVSRKAKLQCQESVQEVPTDERSKAAEHQHPGRIYAKTQIIAPHDDQVLANQRDAIFQEVRRTKSGRLKIPDDSESITGAVVQIARRIQRGAIDHEELLTDNDRLVQEATARISARVEQARRKTTVRPFHSVEEDDPVYFCFDNAIECVMGDGFCGSDEHPGILSVDNSQVIIMSMSDDESYFAKQDDVERQKLETEALFQKKETPTSGISTKLRPALKVLTLNQIKVLPNRRQAETSYLANQDDIDERKLGARALSPKNQHLVSDTGSLVPKIKEGWNQIEVYVTCLSPKPPKLPVREELLSLGVELIYKDNIAFMPELGQARNAPDVGVFLKKLGYANGI
jgi:hypothetical protein